MRRVNFVRRNLSIYNEAKWREREREKKRENTGFLILSRRSINQVNTNCICCSSEFHLLDRYSSRLQFYFRNSFRDGLDIADVKMKILISVFNYVIITICYIYICIVQVASIQFTII